MLLLLLLLFLLLVRFKKWKHLNWFSPGNLFKYLFFKISVKCFCREKRERKRESKSRSSTRSIVHIRLFSFFSSLRLNLLKFIFEGSENCFFFSFVVSVFVGVLIFKYSSSSLMIKNPYNYLNGIRFEHFLVLLVGLYFFLLQFLQGLVVVFSILEILTISYFKVELSRKTL